MIIVYSVNLGLRASFDSKQYFIQNDGYVLIVLNLYLLILLVIYSYNTVD